MIRSALTVAIAAAASSVGAAERSFPVGNFDQIGLGGSPEVTVTTGKAASVRAFGDQRALDRLEIRVEGGKLSIGSKRGINWATWNSFGKVRIAVTVPMLRGVEVGGSGTVLVDRVKVPAFSVEIGGSGSVRIASLDTGKASFEVGGSGNVEAAGRCDSAQASIAGSGAVRIGGLRCQTLSVDVAGSGNVGAYATRSASVSIAGSGDVRVAGGARCAVSKHGSGSVDCAA